MPGERPLCHHPLPSQWVGTLFLPGWNLTKLPGSRIPASHPVAGHFTDEDN